MIQMTNSQEVYQAIALEVHQLLSEKYAIKPKLEIEENLPEALPKMSEKRQVKAS
jgi:hypothetical protein